MKHFIFILIIAAAARIAVAQNTPVIEWSRNHGGSGDDVPTATIPTSDGGYLFAGYTSSSDHDVTFNNGAPDWWICKLDHNGNIEWQKSYGGSGSDEANAAAQTRDGGYIVVGYAGSTDGDVATWHGNEDFWVLKLDRSGNIQWQKSYGGSDDDIAYAVSLSLDGGYFIAGGSDSRDDDVTGHHSINNSDDWIVRIDSVGNIIWKHCYGGTLGDAAYAIATTADNGAVVAGYSLSNDGDVTGHHQPLYPLADVNNPDYWVFKISATGALQWQKSLGGLGVDFATSIVTSPLGGYIVAGYTDSATGDVKLTHGSKDDYWIVKLDTLGHITWQKTLGGTGVDQAYSISVTADSNYLVAGSSKSNNVDVTGNHGGSDFWLTKIDNTGNIIWQTSLGGSADEVAYSAFQTRDLGYIVAGSSQSPAGSGDVVNNFGGLDCWIVRLQDPEAHIFSDTSIINNILFCDSTTIDTVWIHNTGNKYLYLTSQSLFGPQASSFRVISPLAFPDSIAPDDSIPLVIQYSISNNSAASATVGISNNDTTKGRDPWNINLYVFANSTPLLFPDTINFGSVPTDTTRDTTIMLSNFGLVPVCVDTIAAVPNFTLSAPLLPVTLAPGKSIPVAIHFASTSNTGYIIATAGIQISCPCPTLKQFVLIIQSGAGNCNGSATIALPNVNANVGDEIDIPLSITQSQNIAACGASRFTWQLRCNRTLLFPLDSMVQNAISGNDRIMTFASTRTDTIGAIDTLHFIAALGDSISTPLHIESFNWTDGSVPTTYLDGSFQLNNVCLQGSPRLLSANGMLTLSQNSPNPFSDISIIAYHIIEKGHTHLRITDLFGRTITMLVDADMTPGSYSATMRASALQSGAYIFSLQTPTARLSRIMEIIR